MFKYTAVISLLLTTVALSKKIITLPLIEMPPQDHQIKQLYFNAQDPHNLGSCKLLKRF